MAAHDLRLLYYWAPGCQNSAQHNYAHGILDTANKHVSISVWIHDSSQEEKKKGARYKLIVKNMY